MGASNIVKGEPLASALTFAEPASDPAATLHVQTYPIPLSPSGSEVVVQMLAAPINPQDFLITSDIYPIKPSHRLNGESIPGYDGVGRVVETGSQVHHLHSGDLVIPRGQGFGTWRTHALVDAEECAKVPHCSDVRYAAILKMTLLPAYFLVEDLRHIRPGDWVVQNAATSSIGQMVSQFVARKGGHTLSIFRDSDQSTATTNEDTRRSLMERKADIVCTESEFEADGAELLQGKRVVLAIDCSWGKPAEVLAACLPPNTLFVNFGNLSSGNPKGTATFPHSSLFWASATFQGWKSTSSLAKRSDSELDDLTAWIVGLLDKGSLSMPEYRSTAWFLGSASSNGHQQVQDLQTRLIEAVKYSHGTGKRKHKVILEFRK